MTGTRDGPKDLNAIVVAISDLRGDVNTKLARIEERQEASKAAADQRAQNAQEAMAGVHAKMNDLASRRELDAGLKNAARETVELAIRVGKIEEAQRIVAEAAARAALKSGSIGAGIGTGIGAALMTSIQMLLKKMGVTS